MKFNNNEVAPCDTQQLPESCYGNNSSNSGTELLEVEKLETWAADVRENK